MNAMAEAQARFLAAEDALIAARKALHEAQWQHDEAAREATAARRAYDRALHRELDPTVGTKPQLAKGAP